MSDRDKWMIYGANGFTGRLIAQEAKRQGLAPILAVCIPLVIAQRAFSRDPWAVPLGILMCAVFVVVAPVSWRVLFPEGLGRDLFLRENADIAGPEFWLATQERIRAGIQDDVFPYPQDIRFKNRPTLSHPADHADRRL